ncbi:MAG TPA: HAMP domain-containing sensor histidine kinase [Gaiellaceae bacterium]|jgi:two-component system sensor histidine kinase MprB|nr:HAMP domain-containing sensor histidine kinase [Gaiellaceae bacterium]
MSFRARIALLTAVAIAVAVATSSLAVWVIAKHELISQVDQTLYTQANAPGPFGGSALNVTVHADGDVSGPLQGSVPYTSQAAAVAGGAPAYYTSTTIKVTGQTYHVRELVQSDGHGGVVMAVQPLGATDKALNRIRFWILLIGGIGIALAAGLAALVATAALRPVRRLTAAAENVAATGRLTERVAVPGTDELGRLALRFNEMLAALERSVGAQRRLVADASHELRTPLTAVRTNVDLLREGKLPEGEARHALDEASVELDALTRLVSDLVELARGEERQLRLEDIQLDDLVASVVERAQARAPQVRFVTALSPTLVQADPVLLERAVSNLLDNAVKYSPDGAPIEVTVRGGEVVVADHGPGIAEVDLPRVFDRFYRAATARSKPGAGLGLAIVREAAEAHGGTASAESSASGARFKLALPLAPA